VTPRSDYGCTAEAFRRQFPKRRASRDDGITEFLFTTTCHEHLSTLISKTLCNRATNAAVRTRYNRNHTVKSTHNVLLFGIIAVSESRAELQLPRPF
jgi:hypothetical protein